MDFDTLSRLFLAAMFSPPGIANFIISTILKKRWQASVAALLAASAVMFVNKAAFVEKSASFYTISVVCVVVAMMITSHLGFTIGAKVIRKEK
ncbi:hypothetical protein SAMN04515647_4524 [Cohaesibacter sp. ES.047]|uniref:hypothetical protein n=1 Tax=Cohaesibacter sp. ES.047 TaxID=1798205 RepID=UPI000BB98CC6|nr:hypothetical protein [Cohaesibacter sp. ES.047]SNY94199.1 hypothetical protein SAMN04515647_4524 [Cohaesibacter sp. ES.047]